MNKKFYIFILFFFYAVRMQAQNCNLICNGNFDSVFITSSMTFVDSTQLPCWRTTAPDGLIEIWDDGFLSVPAYDGTQFAEICGNYPSTLFQNFFVTPGSSVTINFAHRGRATIDTMSVSIGPVGGPYTTLGYYADGTTTWGYYTVNYTIPTSLGNYYSLRFNSIYSFSPTIGNFLDAVSVNATTVAPVITGGQGVCPNNTTQISVVSTYSQYQWSNSVTTQSNIVGAGTYTVTVTDASGCTGTATYTVAQYPQPNVIPCGNASICLGDSASLCVSGTDSYTWSPATGLSATTGSSVMANPTVTTTYTIIGQDNTTLCTDTTTITVTVNPLPLVAAPPAPSICDGGSVQICMSGAANYSWQPQTGIISASGPDSTCVTVSLSASTTYTVTGYSAEGCSATTTILVTVNPNPVPVINPLGPTVFCSGNSVDLQATPTGTYLWSTSATTQIINVTSSGTFTVTVTDANGCTGTSAPVSVTVNPLPTPAISPANPAFCLGDSTVLTVTGGSSYVWSNSSTSSNITVNSGGTYTVTATDANGCISSTSVNVTVNPPPPAVISPAGPVLICSSTPATLTANSGPGYTYQWYLNGNPIAGATNSTYDASVTGMYTVRVTDALGCTSLSIEVQVMEGLGPVVTIQGPPAFGCLQNTIYIGYGPQSVTLTAVSTTAVSWLWSTGATTQSISVTTSGTYSVTAYDANGCPSQESPESQININVVDVRCGHGLKKIILCHVPEGNPGNPQTICVAPSAIPSHLALHQYDCIGPCSLYYPRMSPVLDDEGKVALYPNPFSNTFVIDMDDFTGESVIMNMYDVTGRILISEMKLTETIELGADLSKGVYHVEIIADGKRGFYKIVKL